MLNQYDWCLYQAGTCEKREPCTGGRRREKTEGTDNWLQTQETDLAQIFPSWLSEGANPAYTVIADLQAPHSETIHFCCYCHPLCFMAAAPASEHERLRITLPTLHSSFHNHTQALGQMIFPGACNSNGVSWPQSFFLPIPWTSHV